VQVGQAENFLNASLLIMNLPSALLPDKFNISLAEMYTFHGLLLRVSCCRRTQRNEDSNWCSFCNHVGDHIRRDVGPVRRAYAVWLECI